MGTITQAGAARVADDNHGFAGATLSSVEPVSVVVGRDVVPLVAALEGARAGSTSKVASRRGRERIQGFLLLADTFALSIGFGVAQIAGLMRGHSLLVSLFTLFVVLLAGIGGGCAHGLYTRDITRADHTTADDVPAVLQIGTTVSFLVGAALWLDTRSADMGRLLVFLAAITSLTLVARAVARTVHRRREDFTQNTIIVGAGSVGQSLAHKLATRHIYGLSVVGFVDDDLPALGHGVQDVPILGAVGDLPRLITTHKVDRVIVAFGVASHERTLELLKSLKRIDVQVDVVPRFFDAFGPNVDIHMIDGLPLIGHPRMSRNRGALSLKRALDLVAALGGLMALAPFLALVAILVKFDSDGPAFYSAERVGRDGRRFRQLKFRTMHSRFCHGSRYGGESAETAFARLLAEDDTLRRQYERSHKLDHDPRVTRVGRILRRTSLDELPQLLNVIRGDLSLVGPRPVTPMELARYGEDVDAFLSVRPGLTGYWQISGRSALTYEERVRLDVAYVNSWSLGLDAKILLRTSNLLTARSGAV